MFKIYFTHPEQVKNRKKVEHSVESKAMIQSNDLLKQYPKSFLKLLIMLKTVNLLVSGMDLFLSHPTPTQVRVVLRTSSSRYICRVVTQQLALLKLLKNLLTFLIVGKHFCLLEHNLRKVKMLKRNMSGCCSSFWQQVKDCLSTFHISKYSRDHVKIIQRTFAPLCL